MLSTVCLLLVVWPMEWKEVAFVVRKCHQFLERIDYRRLEDQASKMLYILEIGLVWVVVPLFDRAELNWG